MKKATVLLMLLISISVVKAQPYVTLGATNKGCTLGGGYVYKHLDMSVLYDTPWESVAESRSLGINLGYKIMLSHWGEDDFVFTPTAGFTNMRSRVFRMDINKDGQKIYTLARKYSTPLPVFGFEIGQNSFNTRFSLVYKYSDTHYFGLSARAFLDKLLKKGGFKSTY